MATRQIGILTAGGDSPGLNAAIRGVGKAAADLIAQKRYGVLVAAHGEGTRPVPLEEVAGTVKTVPPDHPLVLAARRVGTNFGD